MLSQGQRKTALLHILACPTFFNIIASLLTLFKGTVQKLLKKTCRITSWNTRLLPWDSCMYTNCIESLPGQTRWIHTVGRIFRHVFTISTHKVEIERLLRNNGYLHHHVYYRLVLIFYRKCIPQRKVKNRSIYNNRIFKNNGCRQCRRSWSWP